MLVSSVLAVLLLSGGVARAAVGDLEFAECLTGELGVGECDEVVSATADGTDSGLQTPRSLAARSNGRSLYAALGGDAGVARFNVGEDGDLEYAGCIGSDSDAPCALIVGATSGGTGTALSSLEDLALTPGGERLLGASGSSDAVTAFDVAGNGALTRLGCVTGDFGLGECVKTVTAEPNGTDTGMDSPDGLVVGPDGRHAYALSGSDGGFAWFRITGDGTLNYRGCVAADTKATGCEQLPTATENANESGFSSPREIAVSPDGRSLYVVDDSDESIATFKLAEDGSPEFVDCITGQATLTACTPLDTATPTGNDTGMRSLVDVAVSPDGNSVYAVGDSDDTLVHFMRNPRSGRLQFQECFSGYSTTFCDPIPAAGVTSDDSGMGFSTVARVAPDGRSVELSASGDDALVSFRRNPRSGALSFRGCLSGQMIAACGDVPGAVAGGEDSGMDNVRGVTFAPDGSSVYLPARDDAAVVRFERQADGAGPRVKLSAKKRQRARKLKSKITCKDEFCDSVRVKGTLITRGRDASSAARRKLHATVLRSVQAGKATKAVIRLRAKDRKAVKRARSATLKLSATGRDLLGNPATKRVRVKLRT